MKIRQTTLALAAIAGVSLLAACGGSDSSAPEAPAAEAIVLENGMTPKEQIELRQGQLKKLGKAFKTISDELKAGEPDVAAIQAAAASIPVETEGMADWFPAGTGPDSGVKTDALPAIWEDPATFSEKVADFTIASGQLAAVAETGDLETIGAAFGKTGGTCKSCHETFRADD